ncbi:DUF799 domain-containing protein [Bacterioplanoides sp.]|uniref:DUF799 domain-containing protein n=1 Tax=Bacterioplanoides sp. TaxID=2066072 RepID=UPI003B59E786
MKHVKLYTKILFLALLTVLTGCAVTPYDYSALREAKPRSVVVIPPTNSTVEVNAPYIYMSTISQPLAEKGYYVFPVAVVERFMQENGLPTPAEMNAVPLEKIREHIGADAVLYINIEDWGQKYYITSSESVVKVSLKMVDANNGNILWKSQPHAVQPSSNGGGGLIGAIAGAIATQIAGSITDQTPEVSRIANKNAFDDQYRGLLNGPYIKPEKLVTSN